MTDAEYNKCCVDNPRPGDAWYEMHTIMYFVVVDRLSLDEVVVLTCFGNTSASIENSDGTWSFDYSKAITVNRDWIRQEVTYSVDRSKYVADCKNTEKTRKIVSEYIQHKNANPSFVDLVLQKRKAVTDAQKDLEELLAKCPHTNLEPGESHYSNGYDYRGETHFWKKCTVCNKVIENRIKQHNY